MYLGMNACAGEWTHHGPWAHAKKTGAHQAGCAASGMVPDRELAVLLGSVPWHTWHLCIHGTRHLSSIARVPFRISAMLLI